MGSRRAFGTLRKLPSGRWQAGYRLPDLSFRYAENTFERKRDAETWLAGQQVAMRQGNWVDPRRAEVRLSEWMGSWLEAGSVGWKPKTRESYLSLYNSVITPTLGNVPVGRLSRSKVQEWVTALSARGLSASRVQQAYRLLAQVMTAAELEGLVTRTPCVGIKLPRLPEPERRALTREEVGQLLDALPERYRLFVEALVLTGMRFGELAGLQWDCVDLDACELRVRRSLSEVNGHIELVTTKTHQARHVAIPAALARSLAELRHRTTAAGECLVFTSPQGLPVRHQNFMRRVWWPTCERIGLDATPHDLRSTHASWLIAAGWSTVDVAARLGHQSESVTLRHYARSLPGRDRQIASFLDGALVQDDARSSRTLVAREGDGADA